MPKGRYAVGRAPAVSGGASGHCRGGPLLGIGNAPPAGFLVNCNNSPYTCTPNSPLRAADFPRHLANRAETLAKTTRAYRATELLTAKEKLDFLTKIRIRDMILTGIITIAAVLAYLPHEYVEDSLGVSHNTLIAVLAISVILGMFMYLKVFFFRFETSPAPRAQTAWYSKPAPERFMWNCGTSRFAQPHAGIAQAPVAN